MLTALGLVIACGGSDAVVMDPAGSELQDGNSGDPAEGEGGATSPAVMVAINVRTTEDDASLYVGAFPELPSGDVDTSEMIEVSGFGRATAYNGYVYVWEGDSGEYTRFAVGDDLSLTPELTVSFANLGATGPSLTSFVSPTRAFTLTTDNQQIVVWDPTTMEIAGSISTDAFPDPEYPRVEYGEPVIFGEHVAWPILWSDYDNYRFKPEVGVALVRIDALDPAVVVRDSRCGAGWSLFTDAAGDLYATGNAYFGFAHFYGDGASAYPADCVLRMPAGTTAFDPEYQVDLNAVTGSPSVYYTWQVSERTLLAAVWDPADDPALLPSSDDYWNAPLLRQFIDLDTGVSTPVPGIAKSAVWSTLDYRLDGVLYVPESQGTLNPDGTPGPVRTTLYRVTSDGARAAFSVSGDIWGIGRIR